MKKYNYLLCLLLFFLFSCYNEKEKKQNVNSIESKKIIYKNIDDKKTIDSLKSMVTLKGDKDAYKRLYIIYAKELRQGEILLYSLQMAHKYNYSQAYDCIYATLVENENSNDIDSLDEQTRNLATYYLLRAYELGLDESAMLKKIFGEHAPIPKSSIYLDKMKNYDLLVHPNKE